jgi:hypothetical protein
MKGIGSFVSHMLVLAFFMLEACAAGPSDPLRDGPWKGRIIDIDTKEPIQGAVIVAVWERVYRTPAGPNSYLYEAKEVLTDKDRMFEIPAYRPVNLLPLISYMRGPRFIIFKPGYLGLEEYLDENVVDRVVVLQERLRTYRLSPGLIEIPNLEKREERLRNIPGGPTDVGAQKLPLLFRAINEERKLLGLKGEVLR